jgi:3-oxoacyl-[acyl-carrier protein] reductase
MQLGLKHKVALVTGGSRGLGRAICMGLAEEGAWVAVNYCRTGAKPLAAEIERHFQVKTIAIRGDVSKPAQVRTIFDRTERALGPVDILINNAGT